MKRLTSRILAWLLCAGSLCGCAAGPASSGGEACAASVQYQPLDSASAIVQAPAGTGISYALETELLERDHFSDDGVKLASTRYELPVLRAFRGDGQEITEARTPTEEQALLSADTFNGTFDVWRAGSADVAEMVQEDYASRPEMFVEYGMCYQDSLTYTAYVTEHAVSVLASTYSYYGGAHPNTGFCAWTFDLDDGAFLNPCVIAREEVVFEEAVAAELIRQAQAAAAESGYPPEEFYWEDYAQILSNWPAYAVSFDDSGMTVSYAPYELGCYASGSHSFTVSAGFLKPYLSEYGQVLLNL